MASEDCEQLHEALSDARWIETGRGHLDWVAGLTGVEDCIASGLRDSLHAQDWRMFDRYVLAADRQPSSAYTVTLCEALALHTDQLNNDDVVTALDASRDPAAIECLRATLSWEPPWDDARWLALKAIGALAAIGTPAALAVLREAAAGSSDEEIRAEAARELERAGG